MLLPVVGIHFSPAQSVYPANVGGKSFYRVRVGPFKTKYQAIVYKKKFEQNERMAPFVVDPDKVKQAEEIRQRKLEARLKKYGQP